MRLATTTTVQDSGLLEPLVADFQQRSGSHVRTSVQGTGAALALVKNGDVDVVLVHEPAQELEFMRAGYGDRRVLVMYNDFVLAGPPDDPARVRGKRIEDAFRAIAGSMAPFISRGDRSGTDVTEKAVWERIGLRPRAPWYIESGVGQGQSLVVASERKAYVITDRGTFFGRKTNLALEILVEPQPRLLNVYHAMRIAAARVPNANVAGADAFIDYLLSADGQRLIERFGREQHGASLFIPAAGQDERSLR